MIPSTAFMIHQGKGTLTRDSTMINNPAVPVNIENMKAAQSLLKIIAALSNNSRADRKSSGFRLCPPVWPVLQFAMAKSAKHIAMTSVRNPNSRNRSAITLDRPLLNSRA